MVDPVAKWLYSYTVWASCRSSYLSLIFVKCSQIRQKKKKKSGSKISLSILITWVADLYMNFTGRSYMLITSES